MSLSLHPEALEDLRRSGLDDATIASAGLYTPAPGDLPKLLSARLVDRVKHVLVFPYDAPGHAGVWRRDDEFVRCKLFPPVTDGEGHTIRYYQRAGTSPRLYLPPRARASLGNPAGPLFITEGEKKALKADQEGLACLAIGGLWNWQAEGQPIADLDRIDWYERETVLVPDGDVWTRADLLQPVFALGKEIEGRGARVDVLKLPASPSGAKVGLDDYLVVESVAAFQALPRIGLKHALFSKTQTWWRGWTKRKEAPATNGGEPSALDLLRSQDAVRVIHPAQDVLDGTLWYGLSAGKALALVTSARQAYRADRLPDGVALRHADAIPSTVSRDAAVRWLTAGESGSVAAAIDALAAFFLRYTVLPEQRTALWLAAWTLGTWCYRAFRVFPYLSIRSAEKRCGKSRLLGLLARVSFNASPVTAHPTEAQLYRSAARTGGVQLYDEVETLRGDKDRFDTLITVLNVGFERGGVVTRLEKRGDRFVEEAYEVYAPRVLAGIAGLKDTLEERALPLFMLRKRRNEPVTRLGRGIDGEAQALRDNCALASLGRIATIVSAYDDAPALLEREAIDDRAVDLWSPLVTLALAADLEDQGNRTRDVMDVARELSSVREADADAGTTVRLLEALETIRTGHGETITPADLLEALRGRPGWDWMKTPRRLAGLLNPLGIVRRQVREGSARRWYYVLEADRLSDLRSRYGALDDARDGTRAGELSVVPASPSGDMR